MCWLVVQRHLLCVAPREVILADTESPTRKLLQYYASHAPPGECVREELVSGAKYAKVPPRPNTPATIACIPYVC